MILLPIPITSTEFQPYIVIAAVGLALTAVGVAGYFLLGRLMRKPIPRDYAGPEIRMDEIDHPTNFFVYKQDRDKQCEKGELARRWMRIAKDQMGHQAFMNQMLMLEMGDLHGFRDALNRQ